MPFPGLLASMPITKADSLTGVYKVINLENSFPFSRGQEKDPFHGDPLSKDSLKIGSEEEELAFNITFKRMPWPEAMSNLYDYYIREKDLPEAGLVMEALVLEHPTEAAYYDDAANIFGKLNENDKAIFYFKKAFALSPSFDKASHLFVLDLRLDRPADALPYLDYAIQNNSSGANLSPVKQYAEQIIQWQKLAEKDTADASVIGRIAEAYSKMGNKEAADKYAKKLSALKAK
jgi:tetratricopeptide (TPR) repeat protein